MDLISGRKRLGIACIALAASLAPSGIGAASSSSIRTAVFSPHQGFWPGLRDSLEKAGERPNGNRRGKDATGPKASLAHLAIMPIAIKRYAESIPCDSCHRLSANGMEFFLENYLRQSLAKRFGEERVELSAPHLPLLKAKMDLMKVLDSLDFPWDRWLGADSQPVVYRPRDWMTPKSTRERLDRLGGVLGASHLLIPTGLEVDVKPERSDGHKGALAWRFGLVFWNVAAGRPEWALQYSESLPSLDLDASLESNLNGNLLAALDAVPSKVMALVRSEPR